MRNKSFLPSIIMFLVTIMLVGLIAMRATPTVVKTNLENLPMEIDGYKATEDFLPEAVYKELNADKHVLRHYRGTNGKQVDLYMGYYGTAKGGRSGHNPYSCLPGAGWGILDAREVRLKTKYYPSSVEVNYILAQKGNQYGIVLHWYQTAGTKVLSSGIEQNIQRFLGRILYNRNDGAFIRISMLSGEKDIEESNSLTKSFAERILDLIPHYWPVEE